MQPRSILKNSTTSSNAPPSSRPVNKRHLEIALYHANIIEDRKRTEREVLESIMELMEFPTSSTADPKRPSPADALQFRERMRPFQPSDYDALIEERNIADKCGYVLCPRPKRRAPSSAKKHLIDTERGVQIVDRKVLEVWCSEDCARRAMYVKVQLNEEPAWLRKGGAAQPIELMVENAEEHHRVLPLRPKQDKPAPGAAKSEADDVDAAWAARDSAIADLAIERGEKPGGPSKASKDLITEQIKEREQTTPPVAPSPSYGNSHMAIEGHIPRSGTAKDSDSEDDDDKDWEKHLPR
ncbi:uncharacterized protein EI97DRAFT_434112 [Westerdykella ornata]|uniref:RNA polymerase II subunit B1 CTD phosphatase RPAP2 homolog n=1 Tax=Westerdykella ornata TaxID=318751 RepID=A0A6A6JHM1_WESOR|nr:uncharacterized protein EI97DRAFT_434112 [Westerdykella ornata]KAF2275694.1 hypothetical protein EI97DRAFT_434112 [Westerdykella ornata]